MKTNGRAHVIEISNRAALNGTDVVSIGARLDSHVSTDSATAHIIDNIVGLRDELDSKSDLADVYTKTEVHTVLPIIGFDILASSIVTEGQMAWNATEGTADLGLSNGSTLQIGQENVRTVRNGTGSAIANGTPVMFDGALGASGRIKVKPFTGGFDEAHLIYGIATQTINAGEDGIMTIDGKVRGLNTSGSLHGETWADGDILYAKPGVAGGLTKVVPADNELKMVVCAVVNAHATNGTLEIRIHPRNDNAIAKRAVKLETARSIALSGGATGTATLFDGSADITVPITALAGDSIVWSTISSAGKLYTGTTTPTGNTRLNYGGYFYPAFINLTASGDTTTAATHYFVETGSDGFVRPKTLANVQTELVTNALLFARHGAGAFGYTAGAGGTIAQATSRTTNVTLSKYCGNITLFSTTTTAGQTTVFTVTNTLIAATDNLVINHISGGNLGQYIINFTPAAGSFTISVYTPLAQTVDAAPVLRFTVLKGVTA